MIMTSFARLTGLGLVVAAGLQASSAFALTSDALKVQVEEALAIPFGMTLIGAVSDAEVSVTGEGPFDVTVSGGSIAVVDLPDLSFSVTETETGELAIADAAFAADISANIEGIPFVISGLAWSGVWSPVTGDYSSISFDSGELSVSSELGFSAVLSSSSYDIQPYNAERGETAYSLKIGGIDMDMSGMAQFGEPAQTFAFDGLESEGTITSTEPLKIFTAYNVIAEAAMINEGLMVDVDKRKELALDLIDALFQPITAMVSTDKVGSQVQTMSDDEIAMTIRQGSAVQNGIWSQQDNDLWSYKVTSDSEGISGELSSEAEPFIAGSLKSSGANSDVAIENFDPSLMKSALVEVVETGIENPFLVNPDAIANVIRALGSMDLFVEFNDLAVVSDMVGPVANVESASAFYTIGAAQGDDLYQTGYGLSLNGFSTALLTMFMQIPQDAVPTDVEIAINLNHQAIMNFVDKVGAGRIMQALLSGMGEEELMASFAPELLAVYNDLPGDISLDLLLAGQDYKTTINATASATLSEAGEPEAANAYVVIEGLDSLVARMNQLATEVENPMIQNGIASAGFGVMMARGFAQVEGDKLIYDVVVTPDGMVTINGNPMPMF